MIAYFIILIFSICFHELAHLFMALFWKVKVHACSFGFGKVLLHKKWKEIDWRISAIPLGGYCDIEEDLNKPNNLYSISYWKQLTIILAGVLINFLIAFICYWINFQSIKTGLMVDWLLIKAFLLKDETILYQMIYYLQTVHVIILECSLLNITLAITNLFPIPALDGGYIWLLPLRKKLSEKIYKLIIGIGFGSLVISQFWLIWYLYYKG